MSESRHHQKPRHDLERESVREAISICESLSIAAMNWPRYAWICILVGLLILVWVLAAIWQWIMVMLGLLLFGVVAGWFVMQWRKARNEADGWTKAEAYRAYLAEERKSKKKKAPTNAAGVEETPDSEPRRAVHMTKSESEPDVSSSNLGQRKCDYCEETFDLEVSEDRYCSRLCERRDRAEMKRPLVDE